MYKRKLAAGLAAIALLLGGCRIPALPTQTRVDADKYISQYEENWQYRLLSQADKDRYGAIYTVLTDRFTEDEAVTIAGNTCNGVRVALPTPLSTQAEAEILYNAFFRDNPQFFYVGGSYEMEGYLLGDTPCYDTLVLAYTMDAPNRTAAKTALEKAVKAITESIPVTEDEYEIERYLHDRLLEGCTYNDKAATTGFRSFPQAFTAYGALVEGEAVCEGYARGMQLLLNACGIPSTLVIGHSLEKDEDHMWNLVTINGEHYHLDPTWNDTNDRLRHTYFNLTDERLAITHTIAAGQPGIHPCTATTDNYFLREKAYFDTYDRNEIALCVATAFVAGKTVIEMQFAPDKYDNALLFLKNHKLTDSMVNRYVASGEPLWRYELQGDTTTHTLTLVKK